MRMLYVGVVLMLMVSLLGVGAFSTNSEDFNAYNHGWNGYSDVSSTINPGQEAEVMLFTGEIGTLTPSSSVLVLASPSTLSIEHADLLRHFVESGGRLVVCEDYGGANSVLAGVGATTRFTGEPIFDYSNYLINVSLPVAEMMNNESTLELVLNYPTSLRTTDAVVVAYTSSFAFADLNHDYKSALSEHKGRASIVSVERVGNGEVICIADPSVFINAMLHRGNNTQLLEYITEEKGMVAFDQTEMNNPPTVVMRRIIVRSAPVQFLLLLAVLLITLGVFNRKAIYELVERYMKQRG
ncbi:MAG: DUF4350 domain-containing protein [Methermicoccaceae archaeon]